MPPYHISITSRPAFCVLSEIGFLLWQHFFGNIMGRDLDQPHLPIKIYKFSGLYIHIICREAGSAIGLAVFICFTQDYVSGIICFLILSGLWTQRNIFYLIWTFPVHIIIVWDVMFAMFLFFLFFAVCEMKGLTLSQYVWGISRFIQILYICNEWESRNY